MPKTAAKKSLKRGKSGTVIVPPTVNRRREWRFDLPLPAIVEGLLPQGKKFRESVLLENISSGGAFFCLDSGIVVGSKMKLSIDLPKELTEGKKIILKIGGTSVRLENADQKGKKQGVAVRFGKDFRFVPSRQKQ